MSTQLQHYNTTLHPDVEGIQRLLKGDWKTLKAGPNGNGKREREQEVQEVQEVHIYTAR